MPDREKVIKGLECCIGQFPGEDYCKTCAYQPYRFGKCKADAITDALELLKEQDAVEPSVSTAEQRCGHCNKVIEMDGWITCPWCGKMIDWERWWNENGTHDNS